jgi:hypothetical protein
MTGIFIRLRDDTRGFAAIQLAGLIIGPIVAAVIALATINAVRTGTGVTQSLQTGAIAQVTLDDLARTAATATSITVTSDKALTVTVDPAKLPAGLPIDPARFAGQCVTDSWSLSGEGLQTLTHTRATHQAGCASPVTSTDERTVPGLTHDTRFSFANHADNALTPAGSSFTVGVQPAPPGVQESVWKSTKLGTIRLIGTMQETFGDRDIHVASFVR